MPNVGSEVPNLDLEIANHVVEVHDLLAEIADLNAEVRDLKKEVANQKKVVGDPIFPLADPKVGVAEGTLGLLLPHHPAYGSEPGGSELRTTLSALPQNPRDLATAQLRLAIALSLAPNLGAFTIQFTHMSGTHKSVQTTAASAEAFG